MNNFQKLQEEQEKIYYENEGSEHLKKDLLGTLSTFRFIGDVIDVYLPRVVDMFIAIAGGSLPDADIPTKEPDDPASGGISSEKGKGPKDPGGITKFR